MTSRLEEQAEKEARHLARMQAARSEKHAQRTRKSAKAAPIANAAADKPRARFENADGEALDAPGVYWIGVGHDKGGNAVELSPQWICSPLEIAAHTREANGSEWCRLRSAIALYCRLHAVVSGARGLRRARLSALHTVGLTLSRLRFYPRQSRDTRKLGALRLSRVSRLSRVKNSKGESERARSGTVARGDSGM